MKVILTSAVLLLVLFVGVNAQTVAPSGDTQGYDYNQNIQSATLRDHIAIDLGVWLPFGELADVGEIQPGFGFNLHFWKLITDRTFVIGSIGNSWMSMKGIVGPDTAQVDLSNFTFSASPLLGGHRSGLGLSDISILGCHPRRCDHLELDPGSRSASHLHRRQHLLHPCRNGWRCVQRCPLGIDHLLNALRADVRRGLEARRLLTGRIVSMVGLNC